MTLTSIDISTRSLSSSTNDKTPSSTDKEPSAGGDFAAVMNILLAQQTHLASMATPTGSPTAILNPAPALGEKTLMAMATPSALSTDLLPLADALGEKTLMTMSTPATLTTDLLPHPQGVGEKDLAALQNKVPPQEGAGDPMLLTALQIGPHLQVITPQTAAPEGQSLEMFARSQGLDEAALQWLMGTATLTNSPTVLTPPVGMAKDMPTGVLPYPHLRAGDASSIIPLQVQNLSTTPSPWVMAGTGVDVNPKTMDGRGSPANMVPGLAIDPATDDPSPITISVLKADPINELKKEAPAWAGVAATASDWLKSNTIGLNSVKSTVLGKQDLPLKVLDLSQLVAPELLATLDTLNPGEGASGQESPAHGHGSFSGKAEPTTMGRTESSSNGASAPEMDSAQRRENIQNLAEKMGQAVGQRILSELERGQWQLKLSLRPARLGHIEVDMRMRSGEMDAVFTAGQAVTRELLNEGMSKLRDTLNQMGMDVASLKVDDGQSRQRGGESTPDRQANVRDNAPTESADAPASQTVLVPSRMGVDGWDVLV